MKKIILLCAFVVLNIRVAPCLPYNPLDYEHEETRELVRFVMQAADEISRLGEEAFPKFREKGSKWFQGDSYVFVWGLDGMRYVYPPDVNGEGKNMLDLKDISGRPIGRMFVEIAMQPPGEGWVHYQWPKPGEETPTWKSTFIKRVTAPSRKEYLVGSGEYNMQTERVFVIDLVNRTISLLETEGVAGLGTLRSRKSEFVFLDSYVSVIDDQGNQMLNLAFPELEGTNVAGIRDSGSKHFLREVLGILETENDYWVEYMWPKPGHTKPSKRFDYEKKAVLDNQTLIVSAGYYPE